VIYFKHFLKIIKFIIQDPFFSIKDFLADIKKDYFTKKLSKKNNPKIIWCAGLPKSGTTLIEEIFDNLPYVRANTSMLRFYYHNPIQFDYQKKNLSEHDYHGITENNFKYLPKNKLTFFKTHTHFEKKYFDIAERYDAKIIISVRDLRDMMISRYFHIYKEKKNQDHEQIKDLSFEDGFIKSLGIMKNRTMKPVVYYYNWIIEWKKFSEDKKILLLWYENYIHNPHFYIEQILKYLNVDNNLSNQIQNSLERSRKNFSNDLSKNLNHVGKRISTFRTGKSYNWKKYFNKKIEDSFTSMLPGPLDLVTYKENEK
tara:strand:+ start:16014 stop:16952 length:939 start_codon:yes stop_codon:yes gene_type:complete